MKRIIKGILPFLFLILALTFMTNYKQMEDLTDMEAYEIRNFVDSAAETAAASDSGQESERESEKDQPVASSHEEVEDDKTYAFTSDESSVTVYDDSGNEVFHTSLEDWEENRDTYYEKYGFGL